MVLRLGPRWVSRIKPWEVTYGILQTSALKRLPQ